MSFTSAVEGARSNVIIKNTEHDHCNDKAKCVPEGWCPFPPIQNPLHECDPGHDCCQQVTLSKRQNKACGIAAECVAAGQCCGEVILNPDRQCSDGQECCAQA